MAHHPSRVQNKSAEPPLKTGVTASLLPPSIVVTAKVPRDLKSEGRHVVGSYRPIYLDDSGGKHGGDSVYVAVIITAGGTTEGINEVDISQKVRLHAVNGHDGTPMEFVGIEISGFLEALGDDLVTNAAPLPIPREVSLETLVDTVHKASGVILSREQSEAFSSFLESDLGQTRLEIRKEFLRRPTR